MIVKRVDRPRNDIGGVFFWGVHHPHNLHDNAQWGPFRGMRCVLRAPKPRSSISVPPYQKLYRTVFEQPVACGTRVTWFVAFLAVTNGFKIFTGDLRAVCEAIVINRGEGGTGR